MAQRLYVGQGYAERFSYQLDLPDTARCSRRREGWRVRAEAHIRWVVDPRAASELRVVPQPGILALQRGLRDGFGFEQVSWDGSGDGVVYDMRAPRSLVDAIDGVTMYLSVDGGNIVGKLVVNHQEHGLGDLLRSMVGADRQGVPICAAQAQLVTRQGRPNPAGALPVLQSALSAAGVTVPNA